MPNLANAKKALRKSNKISVHNLAIKSDLKTLLKKTRKAIEGKDKDVSEKIQLAQKALDKAIQKKIIKKNTGIRKLKRLVVAYQKSIQKNDEKKA